MPNSQLPFSCGSARTDYAIATDALSCQDYQSVSKKTHTCIKDYPANSSIFLNLSRKLSQ
ncbi:hypothetical protein [Tolypothrix sp. VBCCA 56010]|uniref:hypothetical protein n=1 Tax=Tolypothrix sp. VBCCA 56010 TaxID=3137731 RepID=UPI003D7D5504